MNTFEILHGDAETMLGTLPERSVHCIVTSPPYYGLRDYGIDGQIGLEDSPEAYVQRLVSLFRAAWRVLRDDGTLWLNLGDSMLPNKCEAMIPHRVAMALMEDGWICRSTIIWHKLAPMPESVTDRPTKAHEYVFLLTKNARYFYDAQAVSEPSITPAGMSWEERKALPPTKNAGVSWRNDVSRAAAGTLGNGVSRNRRSVWTLGPQPYAEAHFATMPPKLAELCILAGSSAKGCCPHCGAPWERVVEKAFVGDGNPYGHQKVQGNRTKLNGREMAKRNIERQVTDLGWQPTCTCAPTPDPIPCTVLDPFCGSGTTLAVAINNGRHGIGIELNAEYIELAHKRITGTQPALFGV